MYWKVELIINVKVKRMFEILLNDGYEKFNRLVDQIRNYTSQSPHLLIHSESLQCDPVSPPLVPISDQSTRVQQQGFSPTQSLPWYPLPSAVTAEATE